MKDFKMIGASLVALVALMSAPSAQAQIPVIDPANLAQSVIQAAHALEQIHNQITQIEQQAQMLSRNSLQLSPELSQSIREAHSLLQSAQGLAFDVQSIGDDIRELYPETWSNFNLSEIVARSDDWLAEDRRALARAMQAEARAAQSIDRAQGHIDRALQSSAGSEGQTSAIQAGNQLLGVTAGQLTEIHALLVAQGRALETERMTQTAREERAREIQRRAFPSERASAPAPARSAFEN